MSNEDALVQWRKQVDSRPEQIDPNDVRDWYDMAYGFFLALGFDPETADELAIDATFEDTWKF